MYTAVPQRGWPSKALGHWHQDVLPEEVKLYSSFSQRLHERDCFSRELNKLNAMYRSAVSVLSEQSMFGSQRELNACCGNDRVKYASDALFLPKKLRIECLPHAVSSLAAAESVSQTDHRDCRRGMEGI